MVNSEDDDAKDGTQLKDLQFLGSDINDIF